MEGEVVVKEVAEVAEEEVEEGMRKVVVVEGLGQMKAAMGMKVVMVKMRLEVLVGVSRRVEEE